jgi:hypothetical protein
VAVALCHLMLASRQSVFFRQATGAGVRPLGVRPRR